MGNEDNTTEEFQRTQRGLMCKIGGFEVYLEILRERPLAPSPLIKIEDVQEGDQIIIYFSVKMPQSKSVSGYFISSFSNRQFNFGFNNFDSDLKPFSSTAEGRVKEDELKATVKRFLGNFVIDSLNKYKRGIHHS